VRCDREKGLKKVKGSKTLAVDFDDQYLWKEIINASIDFCQYNGNFDTFIFVSVYNK
jgi:hypothetical protein